MILRPLVPEPRMFTVSALTWDYLLNMGHIVPISVCLHPKNTGGLLTILGMMGVEMKDSMSLATTLARQTVAAKEGLYQDNDIIITIPNDPNFMYDGPSAGLATYTAVLGGPCSAGSQIRYLR